MSNNAIKDKSVKFASRIVLLYKHLQTQKKEFVMSKQILRSGTSIGANINEALCGISKKDFLSKMYIAFKECSETLYWIELLHNGEYITDSEYRSLFRDGQELYKMISSITKTTEQSMNSEEPQTTNNN